MLNIRRLTFSVAILVVAILAAACDPGDVIHFQNKTAEALFVQVNGGGLDRLPAGKSVDGTYLATRIGSGDDPLHILVIDSRGCTVTSVETTVSRFRKEDDFKLAIKESDLPPPDQRAPCDPRLADIARRTKE